MTAYPPDILYAYAQLGLEAGAAPDDIERVLAQATLYRFVTKARVAHIRHLVDFFAARALLGDDTTPFAALRKAYHQRAMALHPDRNKGGKANEDQLKQLNAAYDLITKINAEAKLYFQQSAAQRKEQETEAVKARQQQAGEASDTARPPPRSRARYASTNVAGRTYMAAAVARSMRVTRLGYLPLHTVIGSKVTPKPNDLNLVFDIIMLPPEQFMRAKSHLASPLLQTGLHYGNFAPAYAFQNIQKITVPEDEPDPENFAKAYFCEKFGVKARKPK